MQIILPESAVMGIILAITISIILVFSIIFAMGQVGDRLARSRAGTLCLAVIGLIVGVLMVIASPILWSGWALVGLCLICLIVELRSGGSKDTLSEEDSQTYYAGEDWWNASCTGKRNRCSFKFRIDRTASRIILGLLVEELNKGWYYLRRIKRLKSPMLENEVGPP